MGGRISMRIDLYTKGVLTVIAVLLAVIAFRPYVSPDAVVQAQGSFAGVQFSGAPNNGFAFFDPKTGEIWEYFPNAETVPRRRLTTLGQPLVKEK
jgi:hypothetical protein